MLRLFSGRLINISKENLSGIIFSRKQSEWLASDVNANLFLTHKKNLVSSGVGVAYMGSVCSEEPVYRSSVSEWLQTDLNTAEV